MGLLFHIREMYLTNWDISTANLITKMQGLHNYTQQTKLSPNDHFKLHTSLSTFTPLLFVNNRSCEKMEQYN
jgi:hypothetical protein